MSTPRTSAYGVPVKVKVPQGVVGVSGRLGQGVPTVPHAIKPGVNKTPSKAIRRDLRDDITVRAPLCAFILGPLPSAGNR